MRRVLSRRWIGPVRFTIGALQQILLKRQHTARIAYLPAEAAEAAASAGKSSDGASLSSTVPGGPPLPLLDALRVEAGTDTLDALPQVYWWCTLVSLPAEELERHFVVTGPSLHRCHPAQA